MEKVSSALEGSAQSFEFVRAEGKHARLYYVSAKQGI